jgi:hypothetical protein
MFNGTNNSIYNLPTNADPGYHSNSSARTSNPATVPNTNSEAKKWAKSRNVTPLNTNVNLTVNQKNAISKREENNRKATEEKQRLLNENKKRKNNAANMSRKLGDLQKAAPEPTPRNINDANYKSIFNKLGSEPKPTLAERLGLTRKKVTPFTSEPTSPGRGFRNVQRTRKQAGGSQNKKRQTKRRAKKSAY